MKKHNKILPPKKQISSVITITYFILFYMDLSFVIKCEQFLMVKM